VNKENTIQEALEQLQQVTGINGRVTNAPTLLDDGEVDLTIRGKQHRFALYVRKELRQPQLDQLRDMVTRKPATLVIAERIFPALKEQLRKYNINYLETAGNVFIYIIGHHIWIEGQKTPGTPQIVHNRAFTKAGLKTLFYLLQVDNAINQPYRALASATDTALGTIKNVIEGLRETGFVLEKNANTLLLQNKQELLERWLTGYRVLLKPGITTGTYRMHQPAQEDWKHLPLPDNTVWGGEAAGELYTNYLTAGTLTVYTKESNAVKKEWKLIPDVNGDIELRELFWNQQLPAMPNCTPPLLTYADLMITDDPRCQETAQRIYNKFLTDAFSE
jgi:hypothetical protein